MHCSANFSYLSKFLEKIFQERIDSYLESKGIFDKIDKEMLNINPIEISDLKVGNGRRVVCGDRVLIKIVGYTLSPVVIFENQELELDVGMRSIEKGVNIGLIGMAVGGERSIKILREDIEGSPGTNRSDAIYEVNLLNIKNKYLDQDKIQRFYKSIPVGKQLTCGDSAKVSFNIKDINGKILDNSQEAIEIKIGEKFLPHALELGCIGLTPGSKIILILPAYMLEELSGVSNIQGNVIAEIEIDKEL